MKKLSILLFSMYMMAFLLARSPIVLPIAGGETESKLPDLSTREEAEMKIDQWLQEEIRNWTATDATHEILVVVWANRHLNDYGVSLDDVASELTSRYGARIKRIGYLFQFISAWIPANRIVDFAKLPFAERLFSGTYPRPEVCESSSGPAASKQTLEHIVQETNVSRVWNQGYKGAGMNIAIIDTGINTTRPIAGGIRPDLHFANGTCKVIENHNYSPDGDCLDYHGHGTWVAVTAAGTGLFNATGSIGTFFTSEGTAPQALLLNFKIFGKNGTAIPEDIVWAIQYSTQRGANVTNMSWYCGSPSDGTDLISIAADEAVSKGVVVVVAAGNTLDSDKLDDSWRIAPPAVAFNVIAVGAVNCNDTATIADDEQAHYHVGIGTSYGTSKGPTLDGRTKPDVMASGVNHVYLSDVVSQIIYYVAVNGTSFAAPLVSGIAACLKQAHPSWNPVEVKEAIKSKAQLNNHLLSLSENTRGKGIVNASGAYDASPSTDPVNITVQSVQLISTEYNPFEVCRGGMWKGYKNAREGDKITMSFNVTVRRTDTRSPSNLNVSVGIRRLEYYNRTKYYDIVNTTILLSNSETRVVTLTWNETSTCQNGTWNIVGWAFPTDGSAYWDEGPSGNYKTVSTGFKALELVGDAQPDSVVDVYDTILLGNAFDAIPTSQHWDYRVDFKKDNVIDIYDAILLSSHFRESIDYAGGGYGESTGNEGSGLASVASSIVVDPSSLVVYKDQTSQTFTVDVKINSVTSLHGWQFVLYWNKTILNCTNVAIHNPPIWNETHEYGDGLTNNYNSTHGLYEKGVTNEYPESSFNGSMSIVTLTFLPLTPGTTSLTLSDTKLGNSTALPIDHTVTSGSVSVYYGRYMRSNKETINGLNAYKLNATRTTSSAYYQKSASGQLTVTWGIRAWRRSTNGTEVEINLDGVTGTPKAVVSRSDWGSDIQSATVSVSEKTWESNASLVIRVYVRLGSSSWYQCAQFTTERLTVSKLDAKTWTVYYYTYYNYDEDTDTTTSRFYWGTSTYDSRIRDLKFS